MYNDGERHVRYGSTPERLGKLVSQLDPPGIPLMIRYCHMYTAKMLDS